jgi:hypothetical protein
MTTYNLSVNGANGGASITQNVNTTDTVQITVSLPFGTFISSINASNCSRSPASMSSGSTATISFSGTGSYSVFFLGSTGGKSPTFYSATLNGTVGTSSVTAPTASSVSFNNPASANTTATVNLSANGTGGTLQYACEVGDSTPDNWQSGSTFTISRGSGTVYARARRSSTTNSNVVNATRPGFLTGDTSVSATSSTIAVGATSASTTLSYTTAGETYAVRVNNGSTNLATRTGNGAVSFTSSLPSSGNTSTYEIFVRRPTGTGGDGTTYTATNDTFTVQRTSQDTTPNPGFTLQNVTNAGLSTVYQSVSQQVTGITGTVTVSVSGDGSPQVQIGSGAWTSGPTTITNNYYINARLTSSASNSTAHTATVTVGTYSEDFTVTTVAASSGGGGGISGGSGTYGVEVYDTNGTTTVLSLGTRYITFMTLPASVTVAAGATVLVQQDMTGLQASNCDIAFRGYGALFFTVSRVTTGAVSCQVFSLYIHGTALATASHYIVRF